MTDTRQYLRLEKREHETTVFHYYAGTCCECCGGHQEYVALFKSFEDSLVFIEAKMKREGFKTVEFSKGIKQEIRDLSSLEGGIINLLDKIKKLKEEG